MTAGVELRIVELPLVTPWVTRGGTLTSRPVLIVRILDGADEGWGECAALPAPTYSAEYVDGAVEVLRRHLIPRFLAGGDLADVCGHPMAKAALRTAALDLRLRRSGTSLASHLGVTARAVPAGVAVGFQPSLDALLDAVDAYVAAGYRRVKLKIAPGADVDVVASVRRAHPDLALQVDANSAYSLADAAHLARLDDLQLLLVEQPLAEDDLDGHAELASRIRTPICLDESITSVAAARHALSMRACSVVNVKPGRVGGYEEARAVHDVCVAAGAGAWCGGMLETGLGRAGNVALAALPGFTLPGDLSASDRYFAEDLTEPFVLERGCLAVPTGPGLGREPLPDVLSRRTVWVERAA